MNQQHKKAANLMGRENEHQTKPVRESVFKKNAQSVGVMSCQNRIDPKKRIQICGRNLAFET